MTQPFDDLLVAAQKETACFIWEVRAQTDKYLSFVNRMNYGQYFRLELHPEIITAMFRNLFSS